MKMTIKNLDPTGVEIESEEITLPVIVEHTPENGYKTVVEEDGTVVTYEPARQNRYYLELGGYLYKLNQITGELILIKKEKINN
jgi:hypothetical protein